MLKSSFVLDTNVLLAGLRSKRGASYQLLRLLVKGQLKINVSVSLALEYEDVLKRPGLLVGFSRPEIDTFLDYIFAVANLVPSVPRLRPSLRDPNDERILELAVRCGATIVTHNGKDFEGAARFGVSVLTPGEVLQSLKAEL